MNISSIYGYKPGDVGHAAYCVSKFGVIGLSKTAAIDYGQQGIRVNVVSPGFARSEMVDPNVEATGWGKQRKRLSRLFGCVQTPRSS